MAKKCAVSVCDAESRTKGCCPKHYQRFQGLGLLAGVETVTPKQADDFDRRWEAARETNPRMASGSKGGGAGKTHATPLPKPTPAPTAPPEPIREVAVPAIRATHKAKAITPAKAPPKPLPAPVYPDVRAMDDALLEAVKRERDALSAKAMRLSREFEKLKQDMGSVEGALETVSRDRDAFMVKAIDLAGEVGRLQGAVHDQAAKTRAECRAEMGNFIGCLWLRLFPGEAMPDDLVAEQQRVMDAVAGLRAKADETEHLRSDLGATRRERDGARAKVAAQAEEIERLSADARGFAHDGATAARTLNAMRLTAMLRESEPLRLAFADALNDQALQTLRRAARNPDFSETLAAELMDVPEVG